MNVLREEIENGIKSGFKTTWMVHENYIIEGGIIKGSGNAQLYSPITHKELPSIISKLEPSNSDAILDFAHTYGRFGCSVEADLNGDSVELVQYHIQTISMLNEFAQCIRDNDTALAEQIYKSHLVHEIMPGMDTSQAGPTPMLTFATQAGKALVPSKMSWRTPMEWLMQSACEILNHNIQGVRRQNVIEDGGIKSYFTFESLLDVVYWQINDAIENGEFQRCKGCGKPFISTDGRQRFCPPKYKTEKESPCAIRYRQRKRRSSSI